MCAARMGAIWPSPASPPWRQRTAPSSPPPPPLPTTSSPPTAAQAKGCRRYRNGGDHRHRHQRADQHPQHPQHQRRQAGEHAVPSGARRAAGKDEHGVVRNQRQEGHGARFLSGDAARERDCNDPVEAGDHGCRQRERGGRYPGNRAIQQWRPLHGREYATLGPCMRI